MSVVGWELSKELKPFEKPSGKNNTNILLNSQILEHLYIYIMFLFCELIGGVDFFLEGAMLFFHIP